MHSDRGSSVRSPVEGPEVYTALHRKLKNRHVTMISICSVVGTGIFFGTAISLKNGGPLGILLGYIFMGTICFATMVSLGEMTAFLPLPGGFIKLAERFVDPAFAFATGWNYWYGWTLTLPAELAVSAAIIGYWDPTMATMSVVWIPVGLVIAIGINTLGVGAYGEAEFWFSSIKVLTITGMIIAGIIVDLGGNPRHDLIGFRYWKNPGPFADYYGTGAGGHFLGTCSVLTRAAFAYTGTEAVAMTAGEARNPRRNIPKALRKACLRVVALYIGGVFILGLLVASSDPLLDLNPHNITASPFVLAFAETGIKVLPSIINAAILTSAWSAASCDLYLASRSLHGLAISGGAPKILSRTTRSGLPYVAVGISSCFAFLAYLTIDNVSGEVFSWLAGFSATSGLIVWLGIGVTYLRFYKGMKAQGIDRKTLPFASKLQPYAGWWCVCGCCFVLFFSGWDVFLKNNWSVSRFLTDYIPVVLFPILYVAAKVIMRVPIVSVDTMDFVANVAEFEEMSYDEPPPKNKAEAFWMWLPCRREKYVGAFTSTHVNSPTFHSD
ncbi:amino acid permease [Boletus coccyginus]|nr:amino acid permease [Boletus coccyginus]